jgi:predicted dehydrogenase
MRGPTCTAWASLIPFALQAADEFGIATVAADWREIIASDVDAVSADSR